MFPASRWAARLSRVQRGTPVRCISTKRSGIARKLQGTNNIPPLPSQRKAAPPPPPQKELGQQKEEGRDEETASSPPPSTPSVSDALKEAAASDQNDLLAPVHIPSDPNSILKPDHPAMSILANSTIIVQRQLEMMNIMIGFEQANKYVILDALGNHIGYLAEPEGNMLKRQMFKTHRGFTAHVFDKHEKEVLRITRPFTWINSRVGVYDAVNPDPSIAGLSSDALSGLSPGAIANSTSAQLSSLPTEDMRLIGEVHQRWAPLRRKYELFLNRPTNEEETTSLPHPKAGTIPLSLPTSLQTIDSSHRTINMAQFAAVDERFLSWDFSLLSSRGSLLGSVNRSFRGFAREIFTDTGAYALRMDSASLSEEPSHIVSHSAENALDTQNSASYEGMTLDQRAVMLATAVSIDFDYFSRKSGSGGIMPIPMWMPWGGGAAGEAAGAGAAGAGAAEAAGVGGAVGAAEAGGLSAEVGAAARGAGAVGYGADAGAAGAGSIAGYEAMQRGFGGRGGGADDASPQAYDSYDPYSPQGGQSSDGGGESFWGEASPWDQSSGGGGGSSGGSDGGGGGGGGGEGGGGFDIGDWF